MTEYGIFNDEGCVERGFYAEAKASEAATGDYPDEVDLSVHELYDEQPRDTCEYCWADDWADDEPSEENGRG